MEVAMIHFKHLFPIGDTDSYRLLRLPDGSRRGTRRPKQHRGRRPRACSGSAFQI